MAEYSNDDFGVSFSIPDKLTIRQQLRFRSESAFSSNADKLERFWFGAQELIQDWECERIPNPREVDLATETDPKIVDVINYVASVTAGHMMRLGYIEKND